MYNLLTCFFVLLLALAPVFANDRDVSDFNISDVTWIGDDADVSGRSETSQITSAEVRQNGAICVDYTKKDTLAGRESNVKGRQQPSQGKISYMS